MLHQFVYGTAEGDAIHSEILSPVPTPSQTIDQSIHEQDTI